MWHPTGERPDLILAWSACGMPGLVAFIMQKYDLKTGFHLNECTVLAEAAQVCTCKEGSNMNPPRLPSAASANWEVPMAWTFPSVNSPLLHVHQLRPPQWIVVLV